MKYFMMFEKEKENQGERERFDIEQEDEVDEDCKGPDLLTSEIRAAITDLKNRKAIGIDEIPAEFWKNLDDEATSELIKLCKKI